MVLLEVH